MTSLEKRLRWLSLSERAIFCGQIEDRPVIQRTWARAPKIVDMLKPVRNTFGKICREGSGTQLERESATPTVRQGRRRDRRGVGKFDQSERKRKRLLPLLSSPCHGALLHLSLKFVSLLRKWRTFHINPRRPSVRTYVRTYFARATSRANPLFRSSRVFLGSAASISLLPAIRIRACSERTSERASWRNRCSEQHRAPIEVSSEWRTKPVRF